MNKHPLPDCFAVWYNTHISNGDMSANMEEICEQGFADFYMDGINKAFAKKVHRK